MCSRGSAEPRQGEEDITEPVPCLASCRLNPKMVKWEGVLAAGSVPVSQAAGSWFFLQAGGCFYIALCSLKGAQTACACFFGRALSDLCSQSVAIRWTWENGLSSYCHSFP